MSAYEAQLGWEKCSECRSLRETDECSSSSYVRCPHCGLIQAPDLRAGPSSTLKEATYLNECQNSSCANQFSVLLVSEDAWSGSPQSPNPVRTYTSPALTIPEADALRTNRRINNDLPDKVLYKVVCFVRVETDAAPMAYDEAIDELRHLTELHTDNLYRLEEVDADR